MRWWIYCGTLAVLALVVTPAFHGVSAVADMEVPVAPEASAAPDVDIPDAPGEPSLTPPEAVPVIDFCCARCDGRYNLCVANCGGDPACLQVCEDRFDACASGCAGGC